MAKRKGKVIGIDQKAFGLEPVFNPGETPTDETERRVAYGWAAGWYNYNCKQKDHRSYVLKYAQDELKYSKAKMSKLKLLKDYELSGFLGHPIRIFYRGWQFTKGELLSFKKEYERLYELAKQITDSEKQEVSKVNTPTISPRERLIEKVGSTIGEQFDDLLDSWMDGNYTAKFDTFKLFKQHGLKGNAVEIFRAMVIPYQEEIDDAYNKNCKDAVEAYSHVKKTDQRKMLNMLNTILTDCDSIKASLKAARPVRVKKPKASEKQVEKLKYCKESIEHKLTSINPVMIPGSTRLYTYNVKNRKLTELVTTSVSGFEVSGSSIKNIDPDQSRTVTLRKPQDVIPNVLSKTPNQINKIWEGLTTKTAQANGRINGDTILLRALSK